MISTENPLNRQVNSLLNGSKSDRVENTATNQGKNLTASRPFEQRIDEASLSRNEWEETLGESQLVVASQSLKPKPAQSMLNHGAGGALPNLKNVQMGATAKIKSNLRSSHDQVISNAYSGED